MTLRRLAIVIGVFALVAGVGIALLWQYAFTPAGQARNIIVAFKGDTRGLRPWLISHHLTRPIVFDIPEGGLTHLAAAEMLADLGPDATPVFLEALDNPSPAVRQVAVIACGMTHDGRTFGALCSRLRDGDDNVRFSAMHALAEFGPRAKEVLLETGRTGEQSLRIEAFHAIAKACGGKAIPWLLEMSKDQTPLGGSTALVSGEAVFDIAECGGKPALRALVGLLHDKGRAQMAVRAGLSWRQGCRRRLAAAPRRSESGRGGRQLSLGHIGDASAVPALLKTMGAGSNKCEIVERDIEQALEAMNDKQACEAIFQALRKKTVRNPCEAARMMGKMKETRAIPLLLEMVADTTKSQEKMSQRAAAAGALMRMENKTGSDYLLGEFASTDGKRRFFAEFELAEHLQDKRTLPVLLKDVWDLPKQVYSAYTRSFISCAMCKVADDRAVPTLRKLLKDSNYSVRDNAVSALQKMGLNDRFGRQLDMLPAGK